jgi:hypothetical protein
MMDQHRQQSRFPSRHFTVVPTFTQKRELPLAFGMLGVEDAESDVLFTSTVQGLEADPHVLAAVHNCAGFTSEQAYLLGPARDRSLVAG